MQLMCSSWTLWVISSVTSKKTCILIWRLYTLIKYHEIKPATIKIILFSWVLDTKFLSFCVILSHFWRQHTLVLFFLIFHFLPKHLGLLWTWHWRYCPSYILYIWTSASCSDAWHQHAWLRVLPVNIQKRRLQSPFCIYLLTLGERWAQR